MSTERRTRTRELALAAAAALLAALVLLAPGSASAQEGPYGTTSTTEPVTRNPQCSLSTDSGSPGTQVTATVTGVPPAIVVRIIINGGEVGRDTSEPSSPGSTDGTAIINFAIPTFADGKYAIAATGPTFTVSCGSGQFEVLGSSQGRNPGSGGGSGGRGPLARTGIQVALLVAIGIGLLVAGRAFNDASRRRRRRARRRQRERTSV